MLGIQILNAAAYCPQFNGLVERCNLILKAILRKHVVRFGNSGINFFMAFSEFIVMLPTISLGSFLLFVGSF